MQATVLIVDGIVTNRIMLKVQLSAAYYHVVQAECMEGIVELVQRTQPDLIVAAMTLPDGGAIELRERLAADPVLALIPILAIAVQNDGAARMRALAAGLDDVLNQPVDDRLLQARIRSLLRMRSTVEQFRLSGSGNGPTPLGFSEAGAQFAPPARVVLLAGGADLARQWADQLPSRQGLRFATVGSGDIARLIDAPLTDAFVIRVGPGGNLRGLDLIAYLRARTTTCNAVIIAVTEPKDDATAAEALDRGATDVLSDGFNAQELSLRLATHLNRKAIADHMRASVRDGLREAVIDPMTGLYNRRYALPWLTRTARRAAELRRSFAVMLADLDHFKRVNDRHGHPTGDAVLVETARRLGLVLRPQDMLARIGGEEFMMVLPDIDQGEATAIAGRMCREINSRPFRPSGDMRLDVTISIGVVMGQPGKTSQAAVEADVLIAQADQALYAAKGAGRNKISLIRPAA
ncbi:diguanylate cyclase [Seohaeicola nanhaiensis]|uniref:diguanylate cyclase n=1 Tax=Seohaeicola nanhaiensis TaxID=1387282 RepID=A0ABV9KKK5_9RHOB